MTANIQQLLQRHKLRATATRLAILEELFARREHVNPNQLLDDLRRKGKRVSRATLFRTLSLLIEKGLMRKLHMANGQAEYDQNYGIAEHDHLICLECGRTIEFRDESLRSREQEICAHLNFRPVRRSVKIYGYCTNPTACREEQKKHPPTPDIHFIDEKS